MEPLTILLVDDHVLFRKGLVSVLASRSDLKVVGEANNGLEGVELARELLPDVILMDINMPGWNGLIATRIITRELPHIKIIMLTVSDDDDDLFTAIKYGAQGYLLKNLEPQELLDMLEGIRRNEAPISGVLAGKILCEFKSKSSQMDTIPDMSEALTERVIEVLELVATGLINKKISEKLYITENTVKIHVQNILSKLHLKNRVQAAVYAVYHGMIGDSQDLMSPPKLTRY